MPRRRRPDRLLAPARSERSPAAPEFEQIVGRLLEPKRWNPPELGANARRIADNDRQVVRTIPRWVDLDADGHARSRQQHVEQVANADGAAGAHVVDATRLAPFENQTIGPHGVTDIREI